MYMCFGIEYIWKMTIIGHKSKEFDFEVSFLLCVW